MTEQIWLFVAVWPTLMGGGFMCINLAVLTTTLAWFHEVGHPGWGCGLYGLTMGGWASLFSYTVPVIERGLGVAESFYAVAVITAVLGTIGVSFLKHPTDWPRKLDVQDTDKFSDDATGPEEYHDPIRFEAVSTNPSYQLQLIMLVGLVGGAFGSQFLVSPLLKGNFGASAKQQDAASGFFLLSFAISRLITGVTLGPNITGRAVIIFSAALQTVALVAAGTFLKCMDSTKPSDTVLWSFVAIMALSGAGLGSISTAIPVVVIESYGHRDAPGMLNFLYPAVSFAALPGAFSSWAALVEGHATGDIQGCSAIWFLSAGSVSFIAWVIAIQVAGVPVKGLGRAETKAPDGGQGHLAFPEGHHHAVHYH